LTNAGLCTYENGSVIATYIEGPYKNSVNTYEEENRCMLTVVPIDTHRNCLVDSNHLVKPQKVSDHFCKFKKKVCNQDDIFTDKSDIPLTTNVETNSPLLFANMLASLPFFNTARPIISTKNS